MLRITGTRVFSNVTKCQAPLNVIKLIRKRKTATRCHSTQLGTKVLEHLNDRSVLRISGNETSTFLQGLITNDIAHLEQGAASMYTLFLNTKGRVLYDAIIYKAEESEVYYIECDTQVLSALQKHLKIFRVRKKIDIDSLEGKMKVWTVFDPDVATFDGDNINERSSLIGQIFPCSALNGTTNDETSKLIDDIRICRDPRLSDLGLRILTEFHTESEDVLKHMDPDVMENKDDSSYRAFRYKLGVGEGVAELAPGQAFPLEVNCDYLHGVSFHKGCYIGQELTARTHHTGVVRKRLMPLIFDQIPSDPLQYDEKISNDSGKVVGKIRGQDNEFGLGLLRIADALDAGTLSISGLKLKTAKPTWWPQESPKERISAG